MEKDIKKRTGIKKPGSGRTKGAVSIVTVTLSDLNKVFRNPDMRIAVSRKFVEPFGIEYQLLEGQNVAAVTKTESKIVVQPPEKKIAIRTVNF